MHLSALFCMGKLHVEEIQFSHSLMGNTKLFYFFTTFILFSLWNFKIYPSLFYYDFGNFIFSLKCFILKKTTELQQFKYRGIHEPYKLVHKS